jgi:hypothetical protein
MVLYTTDQSQLVVCMFTLVFRFSRGYGKVPVAEMLNEDI